MSFIFKNMLLLPLLCIALSTISDAANTTVGTWKTAQTIQPFFYDEFSSSLNGIDVRAFTNPADQKTALLAGSLDMAGTTLAHAIHSASQGQPVVVVAALCNKCSALVVRKDGGIVTEKDLKGKTIGYVPGTMHEILLRETLIRNGLSPEKDVTLIRVDFFDMGTALAKGNIDAFLSGEPFPTMATMQGYGQILSYPYYDESVGTINAGMIVDRKLIDTNPKRVEQLVLAHAKATQNLQQNREKWLKKAASFGVPMETLKIATENMELAWKMDEAFIRKAKVLGQRMEQLKMITRQPDYDQLFDLQFVRKALKEMQ